MIRVLLILALMTSSFTGGTTACAQDTPAAQRADRKEPARNEAGALLIAPRTPERLAKSRSNPRLQPQSSGWGTVAGGLSVVVALLLGGAILLRKHGPLGPRSLPAEVLQVLGRRALAQRHSMHLVRLGSRILVIGVSQQGLTTLAEITDPVEVDFLAGLCRPVAADAAAGSFGQLFQRFRADDVPPHNSSESGDAAARRLKDRLHQTAGFDSADATPREELARAHD